MGFRKQEAGLKEAVPGLPSLVCTWERASFLCPPEKKPFPAGV